MKKVLALLIFSTLLISSSVSAQQGSHFSVQYDISIPMGDLGDYITKPSFRGVSFQYRYAVTDYLLLGADAAWNVFYEKMDYDSYTVGTATLSGVQWRTQNEVPLLLSADYLPLPYGSVRPYIGFGLGTLYSERSTDMGTWRLNQDPWHFAIKPEAGVLVDMSSTTAFKLAVKYYAGFAAGELETQSYLTISAGLAFRF